MSSISIPAPLFSSTSTSYTYHSWHAEGRPVPIDLSEAVGNDSATLISLACLRNMSPDLAAGPLQSHFGTMARIDLPSTVVGSHITMRHNSCAFRSDIRSFLRLRVREVARRDVFLQTHSTIWIIEGRSKATAPRRERSFLSHSLPILHRWLHCSDASETSQNLNVETSISLVCSECIIKLVDGAFFVNQFEAQVQRGMAAIFPI